MLDVYIYIYKVRFSELQYGKISCRVYFLLHLLPSLSPPLPAAPPLPPPLLS